MASKSKGTIGVKAEASGFSEFRKAISQLNTEMRTLGSEMKLATSQYDKNDKSIESYTAKNEVLTKEIDKQKEKIDVLSKAYDKAKSELGENNKATQKWLQQLNNATAELNNMQHELNSNNQAIENLGKEVVDLGDDLDNTAKKSSTFKDMLKANLVSDAIVGGLDLLRNSIKSVVSDTLGFAIDSSKALNNLQASTGATNDEMKELTKTMNSIYADNFGSDINDVADSMSIVKQNTGQVGDELKNTTEQALLLRDTFDFDVTESVRAVNTMMQKFGVSSTEAYNLIAQGAQNGLNQNGDLLDVINEYSNQFSQAGLSAEEMFNMLSNGAETGSWSIDKLGDAFKEFSVRMNDGTANEYLKQLGLDAEYTIVQFQKGGVDAQKAMKKITDALSKTTNETSKYTAGVGLFGTMWEDMGLQTITALTGVQGQISLTKNALNELNSVKYNDIGSAMQGLKRQLQVSIAQPIEEKILPLIKEAINWVSEHGQGVVNIVNDLVDGIASLVKFIAENKDMIIFFVGAVGTGFLAWNVSAMITGVVKSIKDATLATQALNFVMGLNPIGLIVTLVAALVAGFVALIATNKDLRESLVRGFQDIGKFFKELWNTIVDGIKDIPNKVKEMWEGLKKKFADAKNYLKNLGSEFITNLWDGIKSAWTNLKNTVKDFFSGIYSDIKQALGFETTELKSNININSNLYAQATTPSRLSTDSIKNTNNNTYNVTIDAKNVKEFNDVVNLAQQQKSANRRVR